MAYTIPTQKLIKNTQLIGSHDSMTYSLKFLDARFAKTQSLTLQQQLDAGVRFFDFRISKKNGYWRIGHGLADTGFTLDYFKMTVQGWWMKNPYETIHVYILINNGLSPATVPTAGQWTDIKSVLPTIEYSDTLTNWDCWNKFVNHTGFDGVAGYANTGAASQLGSNYNLVKTDSATFLNPDNGVHKLVQFNCAGNTGWPIALPYPQGYAEKQIKLLKADLKSGAFKSRPYMYWIDFVDLELINLFKTKLIN